jgi:hypothetical protein
MRLNTGDTHTAHAQREVYMVAAGEAQFKLPTAFGEGMGTTQCSAGSGRARCGQPVLANSLAVYVTINIVTTAIAKQWQTCREQTFSAVSFNDQIF